jgi:hypothetical protein
MGHMKWISTLTQDDLKSMKLLVKFAEMNNEELISFQNSKYEISYIRSVIKLKEDGEITPELNDLLTD